jgi:hypothetical protein
MPRDLERRIQQLCAEVVATDDSEELNRLCNELQLALSEHIAGLREKVIEFKAVTKRRPGRKGD